MISKADFLQAKNFIYSDIQREIDLVSTKCGSGNFLAALGLLCYTEFAGSLMAENAGKGAGVKFNTFFGLLGQKYRDLRRTCNVYSIFRCGLAHEYFVKKDCTISIFVTKGAIGIGKDKSGNYYFAVEQYFRDFKIALDKLEKRLFP